MERSWKVALPAPPPPPVPIWPGFVTPQEYDSTSTSSLCLLSVDSPLMSPIFAKMSTATDSPRQSIEATHHARAGKYRLRSPGSQLLKLVLKRAPRVSHETRASEA